MVTGESVVSKPADEVAAHEGAEGPSAVPAETNSKWGSTRPRAYKLGLKWNISKYNINCNSGKSDETGTSDAK